MKKIFGFVFFLLTLNLVADENRAPGLSGNYQLAYLASDLTVVYRSDEAKKKAVESFDFKKVGTPPVPSPVYLYHDPQGPSATLMGGGSESPRFCEGEAEMLSQTLDCTPLSKKSWKDEKTGCGIQSVFIETVLYSITEDLRYARTEVFIFDKDTEKECQDYKKNLSDELEAGTAPEFFKAMKESGVLTDLKNLPDGFFLSHFYTLSPSKEKAVEFPEGNRTGAYSVTYSGKSRTESWMGDSKNQFKESDFFDSRSESIPVERIGTLLFFHEPENDTLKLAAGGKNKMRNCEKTSANGEKTEVFTCTLFKAKEEEVGTGCTIEHSFKEEVTLVSGENLRYARIEERKLSDASKEGCDNYRKKIASELSEGTAEQFFRILLKTGGIETPEKVGDTFKLIHEYSVTPAN